MARYPKAVWRPLPENAHQPSIKPTQIILHSAVDAPGPTSLFPYFARADVTVESHFFVKLDGTVEQYMDTTVRADANYKANPRAISIETEDEGNPDQRPWTPAQVREIADLVRWLCDAHGIPKRLCPAWDQPGIGYHSMWGAPSEWTPVRGKTCPGAARIPQVLQIVRLVNESTTTKEWDEVASKEEIQAALKGIAPDIAAAVWNHKVHFIGDQRQPATLVVRDIATHSRAGARTVDPKAIADAIVAALPESDARATAQAIVDEVAQRLGAT